MGHRFADLAFTPKVQDLQERYGSRGAYARMDGPDPYNDRLGPDEAAFIAQRDSFYMATLGETGWPYVQHRGGPPGFVRVLDETTIAFADLRGNRQYVSVGNLATDARVSLFFMDYANRARLKLLGHARIVEPDADPALMAALPLPDGRARAERAMVISVAAFDWNCPQHITPRYSEAQVLAMTDALRRRIAELEAHAAELEARLTAEKS